MLRKQKFIPNDAMTFPCSDNCDLTIFNGSFAFDERNARIYSRSTLSVWQQIRMACTGTVKFVANRRERSIER